MKKLTLKDPVKIYKFKQDGYGDLEPLEVYNGLCLFLYGMSESESNFQELKGTDAHAYLDIDDPGILENIAGLELVERIEGMYLVFNRYGANQWYKIERVKIGRTVLTDNVDNNIHIFLSKSVEMVKDSDPGSAYESS